MFKRLFKTFIIVSLIFGAVSLLSILILNEVARAAYTDRVYASVEALPNDNQSRIAIVFGAGLTAKGTPTLVLYDRVATAVDLYKAGKVSKLLLSGDNRFVNYNEPEAMRQVALQMGVPDADLVLDYAGRRTYDSCFRAADIFGVKRAILVTQAFHIDRALYLCNSLGIDAIGLSADLHTYPAGAKTVWSLREMAATAEAWIDLNVTHPLPVLGNKIPIDD